MIMMNDVIMMRMMTTTMIMICLIGWLVGFFTSSSAARLYHGQVPILTSNNFTCCHTETEWGDHDFCLGRAHYTDTDPTMMMIMMMMMMIRMMMLTTIVLHQ